MQPTISSHDFNTKFKEASEQLMKVGQTVDQIQESMVQKLKILEAEYSYASYCQALAKSYSSEKNVCALFNGNEGIYDVYGIDVIPITVKSPVDIFNIRMSGLNNCYFRQDMKASINKSESEKYVDLFKHDSLKTNFFYEEFSTDTVVLTLELSDFSNILYPTRFNMIEIDSFLKGSFTLNKLVIYPMTEDFEKTAAPIEFTDFGALGKNRIILDQKYHFYKIQFSFKLNYSVLNEDTIYYPFAIKHIYLYDADFSENSYTIIPITCDYNIAIVKDTIKVFSNRGTKYTTIKDLGIELYMQYSGGTLSLPFNASTTSQRHEIALNKKTVYAKVPINQAISYIKFYVETRIEDEGLDKEKLIDLLCDCIQKNYQEEHYEATSWESYQIALSEAKSALSSVSDQNTLDNIVIVLSNSIENLIPSN